MRKSRLIKLARRLKSKHRVLRTEHPLILSLKAIGLMANALSLILEGFNHAHNAGTIDEYMNDLEKNNVLSDYKNTADELIKAMRKVKL
jgi:hypothetical protein